MREVAERNHQALWISAVSAKFEGAGAPWTTRDDFDRVFAGFDGVADYPAAIFPAELAADYPEAAIILSVRSEDQWYASMASTLVHFQRARARAGTGSATTGMATLSAMYHRHCWGDDFEATGRRFFREHNDLVRGLAEGRRFLEWRPEDGWGRCVSSLGWTRRKRGRRFRGVTTGWSIRRSFKRRGWGGKGSLVQARCVSSQLLTICVGPHPKKDENRKEEQKNARFHFLPSPWLCGYTPRIPSPSGPVDVYPVFLQLTPDSRVTYTEKRHPHSPARYLQYRTA